MSRSQISRAGAQVHVGRLAEQLVKSELPREHVQPPVWGAWPSLFWLVPRQFHAVQIRIAQVQRFADAMIRRSLQFDTGHDDATERVRERRARGIENRGVVQAGRPWRRRRSTATLPGVER